MSLIHDNFYLNSPLAQRIYHVYMGELPIIDYHNHIDAQAIYEDDTYQNIAQIWLSGDHYKWRLMRANGCAEPLVSGDASDYEKFRAFASTMPYAIGNPVYFWSHLELKRYFDIDLVLNEDNADAIWQQANQYIAEHRVSPRQLIAASQIECMCTTNDPLEDLSYHRLLQDENYSCNVLPTFRPDRAVLIDKQNFVDYIEQLATVTRLPIVDLATLKSALASRIDFFNTQGCKISDHSVENYAYCVSTEAEVAAIFASRMKGEAISNIARNQYVGHMLSWLSEQYYAKQWVMQLHIGALRNNNSELFTTIGSDAGGDSIDDKVALRHLNKLFDHLAACKTIVYHLNNAVTTGLATAIANFQGGGAPGRLQLGPAWWLNDHKKGIVDALDTIAAQGLLGRFVGMLTDSRSFLSFSRHEYFRRIMANYLADLVLAGEFVEDEALLKKTIQNIAYYNIKAYLEV